MVFQGVFCDAQQKLSVTPSVTSVTGPTRPLAKVESVTLSVTLVTLSFLQASRGDQVWQRGVTLVTLVTLIFYFLQWRGFIGFTACFTASFTASQPPTHTRTHSPAKKSFLSVTSVTASHGRLLPFDKRFKFIRSSVGHCQTFPCAFLPV